jgi:hypothetical protein
VRRIFLRSARRWAIVGLVASLSTIEVSLAHAQAQVQAQTPELAPDAQVQISTAPPEGKTSEVDTTLPTPPPEAPPPPPRHKGLVLESTAGVLGYVGMFRHVAPPGFWLHGQLGYEIFRWLMVFGESELSLTDTSEAQDPSSSMAFPLFGFGGGLRGTLHFTERVAAFLQPDIGALEALVPQGSLANLGYPNAESLNVYFGGRLGVEWYQLDRHMALVAQGGVRDATGFAKSAFGGLSAGDTPLLWDAAGGIRYTF